MGTSKTRRRCLVCLFSDDTNTIKRHDSNRRILIIVDASVLTKRFVMKVGVLVPSVAGGRCEETPALGVEYVRFVVWDLYCVVMAQ